MSTSFIRDQPYLSKERVVNLTLPDLLICHLCSGVLWLPVACLSCEATFCTACTKAWKIETPDEPTRCPQGCPEYIQRKCPMAINHILSTLQVKCRFQPNGCSEVLAYGCLETHEELCDYRLRTCSGCDEKIIKMDFNHHHNQCPSVLLTCPECNTISQRRHKDDHTETICLRVQLHALRDQMTENERAQSEQIQQIKSDMNRLTEMIEQLKEQKL